jgi:hypothetical protein
MIGSKDLRQEVSVEKARMYFSTPSNPERLHPGLVKVGHGRSGRIRQQLFKITAVPSLVSFDPINQSSCSRFSLLLRSQALGQHFIRFTLTSPPLRPFRSSPRTLVEFHGKDEAHARIRLARHQNANSFLDVCNISGHSSREGLGLPRASIGFRGSNQT